MISETIEIAAPPFVVRDVFLDFPNLSKWHTAFVHSIESQTPGKATGHDLISGDRILSKIQNAQFNQTIEVNTPTEFRWRGPWHGVLTGVHSFNFIESKVTPGGTTMTQWGEFSGVLAFFMRPGMPGGKGTRKGFLSVNADLKRECERVFGEGK